MIDLAAAFGTMPQTIYLASAAYGTADSGPLYAQCPAGNSDGNIDPNEFLALPVAALLDRNADGRFDRLDPALDFTVQGARLANDLVLSWNAVPGKSYQVRWSSSAAGPWQNATNGFFTAGAGQLTLSFTDVGALSAGRRFYRIELQ